MTSRVIFRALRWYNGLVLCYHYQDHLPILYSFHFTLYTNSCRGWPVRNTVTLTSFMLNTVSLFVVTCASYTLECSEYHLCSECTENECTKCDEGWEIMQLDSNIGVEYPGCYRAVSVELCASFGVEDCSRCEPDKNTDGPGYKCTENASKKTEIAVLGVAVLFVAIVSVVVYVSMIGRRRENMDISRPLSWWNHFIKICHPLSSMRNLKLIFITHKDGETVSNVRDWWKRYQVLPCILIKLLHILKLVKNCNTYFLIGCITTNPTEMIISQHATAECWICLCH